VAKVEHWHSVATEMDVCGNFHSHRYRTNAIDV